jgi:hypothetical protein
MDNKERKDKIFTIRTSKAQNELVDKCKNHNPRVNSSDVFMSGIGLLSILLERHPSNSILYNELLNALIIRDDLKRCISKPLNPCIDNTKNELSLNKALSDNESLIIELIISLIS